MRNELVVLLETLGYPVFQQGSLNSAEDYPDSFFTYWCFDAPESSFYDDDPHRCIWGFWVYFYSTDPLLVETVSENARKLLKNNGWTAQGRPTDAQTSVITHTGAMFTIYNIDNYQND